MPAKLKATARPDRCEVKALRNLEVRLLGISREFGEALARVRAAGAPTASRRRLTFRPAVSALPARRRLRFAPLPAEVDRLVVTNWNATPGVVALGDFELELEPGQSAALWVNRTAPLPRTEALYEQAIERGPGYVFADAGPLL